MSTKTTNILYWVTTILLCALMLFSGVTSIMNGPDSQKIMVDQLHYPVYFGPFLGVAKVLGVIALLVPGFPKIREWAYAGFTFDLIGAMYSVIAIGGGVKDAAIFPVFIIILATSYICNRKRQVAAGVREVAV